MLLKWGGLEGEQPDSTCSMLSEHSLFIMYYLRDSISISIHVVKNIVCVTCENFAIVIFLISLLSTVALNCES